MAVILFALDRGFYHYWVKSSWFLASPDTLEVIVGTYLLSVRTDLTDVTLVSDDTY